jgi:uncharacterized protein YndB with AHSA1/START domain
MAVMNISRHIRAPREKIFQALVDADALRKWKVPDGMTMQIHEFEGREGGRLRISLTYTEPTAKGKSTAHTDTYRGYFKTIVPNEKIVEVDEFETTDPMLRGAMTITMTLSDVAGGTMLTAVHDGLPDGVPVRDNQTGWQMALDKLAALVEA